MRKEIVSGQNRPILGSLGKTVQFFQCTADGDGPCTAKKNSTKFRGPGGVSSTNPFLLDHCRKADKKRADCGKYFMRKEIVLGQNRPILTSRSWGKTVQFFQCTADGDGPCTAKKNWCTAMDLTSKPNLWTTSKRRPDEKQTSEQTTWKVHTCKCEWTSTARPPPARPPRPDVVPM